MRKRINKLCVALAVLCSACFTFNTVKTLSVYAATNNTVDTVSFTMEAGASVRIDENGNGIRYQVKMPAAEHTALEENTTYSQVTYGILVAPADYEKTYGALDKANVFGISSTGSAVVPKYDWATKNEEGEWQYNGDGSKIRIMNFQTGKLTEYTAENGEEMARYLGSITNLDEDNIVRDFVGVGYIKYTVAETGKTDYVFAERNDNVRSMADVARRAIASETESATNKAVLKKTYLEDVYNSYLQFDTAASKQIVEGAALSWDSVGENDYAVSALVKYDDFDADGEGNEDATTTGRQDLVIDMGGVYKVKEIESVVIRYRYLNASKLSMHLYVNDLKTDANLRMTGFTYQGAAANWYTPTVTEDFATLTIPQSSLKSNSLGASTLLTAEDYLTAISFGTTAWQNSSNYMNFRTTVQIDSVEVNVYNEEYLEFNDDGALDIISGLGKQMVDLDNGNKAVQATFKNDDVDDTSTTIDDGVANKINFRINMGGIYKVSEIESVVISYKIISGDANLWWRLNLNDIYTDSRRVMGSGLVKYSSSTTSRGTPTANFETITITNAGLLQNKDAGNNNAVNTILSESDYLTSISFSNASIQHVLKYRCTIQIDYIRVNLKSA